MKTTPSFGFVSTLLAFGGAGVLLLISTRLLIPYFSESTVIEPVLLWFLTAGLLVFAPLILAGFLILKNEGVTDNRNRIFNRLRFRKPTRQDWLWIIGSLIIIGIFTAIFQFVVELFYEEVSLQPPFIAFETLDAGRYWIIAAWIPFWILNIMGEEILWRGVILPRQEISFGRQAWLINAMGWTLFHIAFGWVMVVLFSPILFILPYVTQKAQNTWVAVIIHAGLNGPGFLAVAFGVV